MNGSISFQCKNCASITPEANKQWSFMLGIRMMYSPESVFQGYN